MNKVRSGIDDTTEALLSLTALVDCNNLHEDYIDALQAVCHMSLWVPAYLCLTNHCHKSVNEAYLAKLIIITWIYEYPPIISHQSLLLAFRSLLQTGKTESGILVCQLFMRQFQYWYQPFGHYKLLKCCSSKFQMASHALQVSQHIKHTVSQLHEACKIVP